MRKKNLSMKKNDRVIVMTGKEKGKIGTVLKVDSEKGRVIVEKVNMVKRHTRAGGKSVQGGIIEKEAPIHISNIMLVCNKCSKPVRVGFRVLPDGKRVRVCRSCAEVID